MRTAPVAIVLFLVPLGGCAYYDLDVEGKQCNQDHPCPSGYQCVDAADGGRVCKKDVPDAGLDGADTGPCREGQTACPSLEELAVCHDGEWDYQECPGDKYCFDPEGSAAAACVDPCSDHADCEAIDDDYYCDNGYCTHKGDCTESVATVDQDRCGPNLREVRHCSSETGIDRTVQQCGSDEYCDVYQTTCLPYCDDDTGCSAPGTSCNPATRKCVPMTLCASDDDCTDSICVDPPAGACVKHPTVQVQTHGGSANLDCYTGDPGADAGPATCTLAGRIVFFFNRNLVQYDPNLSVRLYPLDDVLAGILQDPLEAEVTDDGSGKAAFSFDAVPTGTEFVMAVDCPEQPCELLYSTLYTFSVYLRADDCETNGGQIDMGAPSIYEANYGTYNEVVGPSNDDRGLVLGWLKDCKDPSDKIENGTGGISMDSEILYYLPDSEQPDLEDTDTNSPGFFAAANVVPIRGMAGALVLDQGSAVSLRARPVRVFRQKASLVIFDKPKKPAD